MNAAIYAGTKVIFTSRDYIYTAAKRYLKESALPLIKESQVVINVENLTKDEREQILYNHIKLGNQDISYKTKIKPFLPDVVLHNKFSPEIARRLGNQFFTGGLTVSKSGLKDFIENPLDMLCEIINTMDDTNRSALALIFIRGGALPSPLDITNDEEQAIRRLGGSVGDAIKGLEALNGSLLLRSIVDGNYFWHFKHPTIRDAFAAIVASSHDLMDIYLMGAPLDKLFSEITCGEVEVQGAKVIVPVSEYETVIGKMKDLDTTRRIKKSSLYSFLSYRCDKTFLSQFLNQFPVFISNLSVSAYIYASSDVDILARLHEYNLLPEDDRVRTVNSIRKLATEVPDAGFLAENVKGMMSDNELSSILQVVQDNLLPNLDDIIDSWRDNYDWQDDPDVYFHELRSALDNYRHEFEENITSCKQIDDARERIRQEVMDLYSEYGPEYEDEDYWNNSDSTSSKHRESRSIFDDVDA